MPSHGPGRGVLHPSHTLVFQPTTHNTPSILTCGNFVPLYTPHPTPTEQHRASTLPTLDATRDATTCKLSDQNLPRVPGGLMSGIVTPASAAAADVATPDALMAALHFIRPGGGPLEEAQSRGNCTRLLRAMQHAGVNLKVRDMMIQVRKS